MKGLVLNNWYSILPNIKSALYSSILLILFVMFFGEKSFIDIAILLQFLLFVYTSSNLIIDEESRDWNKYEVTLPAKRSSIVLSKYMIFLITLLIATSMSLVTVIIAYLTIGNIEILSYSGEIFNGLFLSLYFFSFAYPLTIKHGTRKKEWVLTLSILLCFFLLFVAAYLIILVISLFDPKLVLVENDYILTIASTLLTLSCIPAFVISYFKSVKMYQYKDFADFY
ncbi:ABC-2 transporter permease [Peptostreptococcus faecalis]|uniref:ABC-2 transporter permease n=1 Tax=Peptostreptococcus faecalis TaxID=2045015 RepID=UPI0015E0EAFA|nr:ABC-2 transporter permease [Peptostreptococcus faecalis]